jgi:hypothetical protein
MLMVTWFGLVTESSVSEGISDFKTFFENIVRVRSFYSGVQRQLVVWMECLGWSSSRLCPTTFDP